MNVVTRNKMESYLKSLGRRRKNGSITADDAHAFLDKKSVPRRVRVRLSYINSVLRSPEFISVGLTTSTRPAAKSRRINRWLVG